MNRTVTSGPNGVLFIEVPLCHAYWHLPCCLGCAEGCELCSVGQQIWALSGECTYAHTYVHTHIRTYICTYVCTYYTCVYVGTAAMEKVCIQTSYVFLSRFRGDVCMPSGAAAVVTGFVENILLLFEDHVTIMAQY